MADDYVDVIGQALDGRVDFVVGESYGGIGQDLPPSDLLVGTEAEFAFDARPVLPGIGGIWPAPITRASGTKRVVLARYARNKRLADAPYQQAFAALTKSPGARAFYDRHRDRGATHHQALRALADRLVALLHGCLTHHVAYEAGRMTY